MQFIKKHKLKIIEVATYGLLIILIIKELANWKLLSN